MIDGYRFGWMKVAGEEHGKDLIVFAPGVRGEEETVEGAWWRKEGHGLDPVDLAAVEAARPRVLVIGRGAHGRMVVPEKTLGRGKLVGVPTAGGVISTGGRRIMDLGFLRTPGRGW
ncbi:MAG: MTH938/NDUFAF3 family protein, partial [Planctomycetota bacterium]